eukprot:725588-Amphidinium_carterae.1
MEEPETSSEVWSETSPTTFSTPMTAIDEEIEELALGGTKERGRMQWASTTAIQGVKLACTVVSDNVKLEPLALPSLCDNATGYCFATLTDVDTLLPMNSDRPLIIVFPGDVEQRLKDRSIDSTKLKVEEVPLHPPLDDVTIVRRRVTLYQVAGGDVKVGSELVAVKWKPAASMEIILELDGRWATAQTLEQVAASWKSTAVHMLGQRAATTVTSMDLYGCTE